MLVRYRKIKEFKDNIGHYLEVIIFFNILVKILQMNSLFVNLDSLGQLLMHLLLKYHNTYIIKIQIIETAYLQLKDVQYFYLSLDMVVLTPLSKVFLGLRQALVEKYNRNLYR